MLILTRSDVEAALDLDELVDAVASALADLSAGRASMPPRTAATVPGRDAFLGVMPAHLPSANALVTKLVAVFPHNRNRPTHQAVITCFDPDNGAAVALMDGTYITEARTAAGSALATRLLAPAEASHLALLGTGAQALAHARAVVRVRPIERVRLAGRNPNKSERLARKLSSELDLVVEPVDTYEIAMRDADVVCACTHSPEPVVRREWIEPGTHINSVGFNPAGREVDAETVRDARVVVESRDSALAAPPAGSNDLLWPVRDGVISQEHVGVELGELVSGSVPGRTSDEEITLYKSVGVAVEDAAAAAVVLQRALDAGAGMRIDL